MSQYHLEKYYQILSYYRVITWISEKFVWLPIACLGTLLVLSLLGEGQ